MTKKTAFTDYLKTKSLKLTREREAIIDCVIGQTGHFDPEELCADLRRNGMDVSRASVYRTLPLLIDSGILEQVERTDKHAHYELKMGRGHHDHMLCVQCGRVIEFYSPELERLQERICRREGFAGQTHTLEIKGRCKKCGKRN